MNHVVTVLSASLVVLLLSTSVWSGNDRSRPTTTIRQPPAGRSVIKKKTTVGPEAIQKRSEPKPDMTKPPSGTIWGKIKERASILRAVVKEKVYSYIPQTCGNSAVEGREECDDGNTVNGDGCSCSCYNEPVGVDHCGNGICEPGEMDPVVINSYGDMAPRCLQDCDVHDNPNPPPHTIVCGNCMVDAGGEECDDGNRRDRDGCSNYCRIDEDERDQRLCELPSGTDAPSGMIFREYDAVRHISRCEDGDTTRYIICGTEVPTINVIDCAGCTRCSDGACRDTEPFPVACTDDSDDPHVSGHIFITMCRGSGYIYNDDCAVDDATVNEVYCTPGYREGRRSVSCPAGEICQYGICVTPPPPPPPPPTWTSCSDTDSENDPHVRGVATATSSRGETSSGEDQCHYSCDDSRLDDAICAERRVSETSLRCPAGEYCDQGICVRGVTPTCSDNDPTGNLFFRGTLTYTTARGERRTLDDACESSTQVREYNCGSDGRPVDCDGAFIDCPDSAHCYEGACITNTCTDTDPADDTHIVGELTTNNNNNGARDSCVDFHTVREFYCTESRTGDFRSVACGAAESCAEGACVPGACASCRMTVPTESHAGFVTGIDCVVQDDICRDNELIRFRCGSDGMPEEDPATYQTCEFGCRNGLCCASGSPCL